MEEQNLRVIIEIARRRNGRVDRRRLDDDNATSLKHGNEKFLNYMLDSVFVGSKWINWLAEPVIAYAHSPPQSEKSEKSNIIWGIWKKKGGGSEKGGWNLASSPPGSAPCTVVTQCCIIIPIRTLICSYYICFFSWEVARTASPDIRAMSPQTPSYIARNCIHVLMSILATIVTRNFSKKLRLKSLRGMFEETHAPLFVYCLTKKKIKRPFVAWYVTMLLRFHSHGNDWNKIKV